MKTILIVADTLAAYNAYTHMGYLPADTQFAYCINSMANVGILSRYSNVVDVHYITYTIDQNLLDYFDRNGL